jgi:hypothetical protein
MPGGGWTVWTASAGSGGLDLEILTAGGTLADVDKRRYIGMAGSKRAGDHGTNVGRCDRLRRHVAGVPMVLMPRMENEAEVPRLEGTDERAVVHDLGDLR